MLTYFFQACCLHALQSERAVHHGGASFKVILYQGYIFSPKLYSFSTPLFQNDIFFSPSTVQIGGKYILYPSLSTICCLNSSLIDFSLSFFLLFSLFFNHIFSKKILNYILWWKIYIPVLYSKGSTTRCNERCFGQIFT